MLRSLIVRVVLCLVVPVLPVWGQRLSSTFDANAQGWGTTGDRRYSGDGGFAAEAVMARRVRPFSHGALLVGGAAALHGVLKGDSCRLAAPPVPDEPLACLPGAPSFALFSALGGVEGTRGLTARLVGGPAVFLAGARGTALGFQGRADVATPALFHLALVISARGAVVPNFEGGSMRFVAFGLGLGIR
jgi:hypothetical protein